MLKMISKFVVAAAVAAIVVSFSTPSFAAKKKKGAPPATCAAWQYKMAECHGTMCHMYRCGLDGKWYPSMLMCWQPACPK